MLDFQSDRIGSYFELDLDMPSKNTANYKISPNKHSISKSLYSPGNSV